MDPRDDDLTTLLHDAVADVEPADRLGEIRAAVLPKRSRFGWYGAGGTLLAVAAAATAFAVVTSQDTPKADDPGPLTSPTVVEPTPTSGLRATAVYYVGDTPFGERLYREFKLLGGWGAPVGAQAVTTAPDDPDYRTLWPAGSVELAGVNDGVITVTVSATVHDRPANMTAAQAELAIEQMIYTVQASEGARLPVQFKVGDNPVDQVFGVPTSEPLANKPQLDVLAQMSISNPAEGRVVDGSFTADGAAISFEGNVLWELRAEDGTVVRDGFATAGMDDHLIPWETEPIDVSDLDPGTYVFEARTEGGSPFVDTRTIVIE